MLEQSVNTQRALSLPRPRLRGISHLAAFVVWLPLATALVVSAPGVVATLAVGAFGLGVAAMFGASALAHRRRWSAHATEVLLRVDHTAIYLAIAGSATPLALLGLTGWARWLLLVGVWSVAAVGIVVEWLPFAPPRGFSNGVYLTMSWLTVLLVPNLVGHAGWTALALLAAGGVLYTAGAVILALRRPDPDPHVFGYHEIWHLLVIAAVAAHTALVAFVLLPLA